jgi:hypothetical protein
MHPPPPAGCHNELFAAASLALVSPIFRRQKSFRVNRRRATRARGRDGLPVNVIRAVACHEDAGNQESGWPILPKPGPVMSFLPGHGCLDGQRVRLCPFKAFASFIGCQTER